MFDIEYWRLEAEHAGRKRPAVVTDQKDRSTGLQDAVCLPNDGQRIAQVLDRLEATHQAELIFRKYPSLKKPLLNQGTHPLISALDGRGRRLDPGHTGKVLVQQ